MLVVVIAGCQAGASPPPGKDKLKPPPKAPPAAKASPPGHCRYGGLPVRKGTDWSGDSSLSGAKRSALARKNKLAEATALFKKAKLKWPPRQLLLRVYKAQQVMEVWASDKASGKLTQVANYAICATSGYAGPKKREGDGQVPEGFYTIDYFKNRSTFYLALRVSYPNRRDRKLKYTGSAIMIHGNCVSIGCMAMTDERIQELWVMARAMRKARRKVTVHIFPSCDMQGAISGAQSPKLKAFWQNIQLGFSRFNASNELPRWKVGKLGEYVFY